MKLTSYRRITQVLFILLILLMPVLNIFRYDTDTHDLIIFGNIWNLGWNMVSMRSKCIRRVPYRCPDLLKAILPGSFSRPVPAPWIPDRTILLRLALSEGALFEFADFLTLKLIGRRSLFGKKPSDPMCRSRTGCATASCSSEPYFDPLVNGCGAHRLFNRPKTIWHQIVTWDFTSASRPASSAWRSTWYHVLFVRHVLCKFICAAGLMQMLFGWISQYLSGSGWIREECRMHGLQRLRPGLLHERDPAKEQEGHLLCELRACIEACNKELGRDGTVHLDLDRAVRCSGELQKYRLKEAPKKTG